MQYSCFHVRTELSLSLQVKGLVLTKIFFSDAWAVPASSVIDSLGVAHRSGMQSGDLFNAFRCWAASNIIAYCSGYPLHVLLQSPLMSQLKHYRLQFLVVLVEPFESLMAHLRGKSDSPVDWGEIQSANPSGNSPSETLKWSYWCWSAVQLSYYFGKLEIGYKLLAPYARLSAIDVAYFSTSICVFFSGLTCSGLAKKTGKRKYVKEARRATDKMKFIMRNRGLNNLHRYLLMQAELLALTSKKRHQNVKMAYDKAIATAGKAGFVQDAALANELAFEYFRSIGDEYWAGHYIVRACELYHEWGASAKVGILKNEHSSYLNDSRNFSVLASRTADNSDSHMISSTRNWFSGEGSTRIVKSIDLDSLSFARTSATDMTKNLSATVGDLRGRQPQ